MLLFWNLSIIQPHFTPNIASDSKHWNIPIQVLFLSSFLTLSTYIKSSRCNSQHFLTYYFPTTRIIHVNFSRHWVRIKTAFYCRRSKANRRSWDGTYTTKNSSIHRSTSSKIISYNDQICKRRSFLSLVIELPSFNESQWKCILVVVFIDAVVDLDAWVSSFSDFYSFVGFISDLLPVYVAEDAVFAHGWDSASWVFF